MNKQSGFTLIEIVMVLVLLGILSAVAVPKYFDLQEQAEAKAVQAVGAEYQARINAVFAQNLLSGKTCADAWDAAASYLANETSDGEENPNLKEGKYTVKLTTPPASETNKGVLTITIDNSSKTEGYNYDLVYPKCEKYNEKDSDENN